MIVAIMQPYFFPYIGYFQLMGAVDLFVVFDDVQYIDRGWVNRNKIMIDGEAKWLTFPVLNDNRNLKINERYYLHDPENIDALKRRVRAGYERSPYFDTAFALFSEILDFEDGNVARFNANLLRRVGNEIGLHCEYAMSSAFDIPPEMKGQERVLALCKRVGATHYVNPVGGLALYQHVAFAREGIELSFLETRASPHSFTQGPQHLSILDRLMRLGPLGCQQLLPEYVLTHGKDSTAAA
jgi:hypothetical protein